MSRTILGIDGKIRGALSHDHELSHIGVALSEDDIFSSYIGPKPTAHGDAVITVSDGNTADSSVHPSPGQVDGRLVDWLNAHGMAKGTVVLAGWRLMDVGWPQLCSVLPKFTEYLHPHVIELPTLVHVLDGAKTYLGSHRDYSSWEKMARTIASYEMLNLTGQPLRASHPGDNALLALLSWRWLQKVMSMPATEVALSMSGGVEVVGDFDG